MRRTSWQSYWANEANHEWWERPQPEVIAFIESQLPAARRMVLDLGCGIGRHAIAFALAGFNVTATDASAEAVCHLDHWAKELGLSVRTQICDSVADGFPPESFDIVLSYNVIYHGYRQQFAAAIGGPSGLHSACACVYDALYKNSGSDHVWDSVPGEEQ